MRRAPWVGLGAGVVSLGLHASGLVAFAPKPPQALSGGPQQLAMVGNSFEDAVAGRIAASETTAETESLEVSNRLVSATPVTSVAEAAQVAPVRMTAAEIATTSQTRSAEPAPRVMATPPVTITVRAPVIAGLPQTVPAAPEAAQALPAEPSSAIPSPQPERIAARPAPAVRTPDADTPRPLVRAPRSERMDETRTGPPPPAPAGSAEQTTRAGAADGQPKGNAAQTAQGGAAQSASDGRAAARYPQEVNRHLARLRRPNARFDGAAVIAFTIGPGGGFAALSVARSSGNADFDRIAISHVHRAAPFPVPPPGAQRSFNVTVQGR
jgi:protein TonB